MADGSRVVKHALVLVTCTYQENMRGQRGTLRALARIYDATKVIFSFRKSVFRDVRTDYNPDLRSFVKKQISMIMADLS